MWQMQNNTESQDNNTTQHLPAHDLYLPHLTERFDKMCTRGYRWYFFGGGGGGNLLAFTPALASVRPLHATSQGHGARHTPHLCIPQALLSAVGVGAGGTSLPLAATLSWVLRDGVGQGGGILFAATMKNFDAKAKSANWWGVIIMQLATAIELSTPFFPWLFLPLAGLCSLLVYMWLRLARIARLPCQHGPGPPPATSNSHSWGWHSVPLLPAS